MSIRSDSSSEIFLSDGSLKSSLRILRDTTSVSFRVQLAVANKKLAAEIKRKYPLIFTDVPGQRAASPAFTTP
jgi:hypothetical protein